MERATEEERKRGEEEGRRKEIETELFELSAGLFGQLNTGGRGTDQPNEWRSAKRRCLRNQNRPMSLRALCGCSKRREMGSNVSSANYKGPSRLSIVIGQAVGDYVLVSTIQGVYFVCRTLARSCSLEPHSAHHLHTPCTPILGSASYRRFVSINIFTF